VNPCNGILYSAKNHPKFYEKLSNQEDLEKIIKDKKEANKMTIPYGFGCFSACP